MHIQINTDHNIEGHAARAEALSGIVEDSLGRFRGQVTRVEVHVSDQNSGAKGGGDDIRCVIEARLEGRQPIAVTDNAANVGLAVEGAASKLVRKIEHTLGRQHDQRGRERITQLAEPTAED